MSRDIVAKTGEYTSAVRAYLQSLIVPVRARRTEFCERAGISTSTLYRRLAEEGSYWPRLYDEELKRRCDVMLADGWRGRDIAEALGYMERMAFYRAFRRWYGRGYLEMKQAA